MLIKPFPGLFQLGKTNTILFFPVFNDLKPLKTAAHPFAAIGLPKNGVFQQPYKAKSAHFSLR